MTEDEIREIAKNSKWGFLRETDQSAKKAGNDKDTGLIRTGLPTYLKKIYPNVNDWIHDQEIDEEETKKANIEHKEYRPDYRSKELKLVIEFDGIQHYTKPDQIKTDRIKDMYYTALKYKIVRIPYFIQLSKTAVKTFFDVDVDCELFDERIPSLGIKSKNTPAFLCGAGVVRMAKDFKKFPSQYKTNIEYLESQNDEYLTGVELLKKLYKED